MRKTYTTGAKWEDIVGYSRAVQVGNQLEVTGTVAVDDDGKLVGEGDYYLQTNFIIEKINRVLLQAGFSLEDVVRTRMFVIDINKWEDVGRAHAKFFDEIKPATTMVQVSALISPEFLVEIEVSAIKTS